MRYRTYAGAMAAIPAALICAAPASATAFSTAVPSEMSDEALLAVVGGSLGGTALVAMGGWWALRETAKRRDRKTALGKEMSDTWGLISACEDQIDAHLADLAETKLSSRLDRVVKAIPNRFRYPIDCRFNTLLAGIEKSSNDYAELRQDGDIPFSAQYLEAAAERAETLQSLAATFQSLDRDFAKLVEDARRGAAQLAPIGLARFARTISEQLRNENGEVFPEDLDDDVLWGDLPSNFLETIAPETEKAPAVASPETDDCADFDVESSVADDTDVEPLVLDVTVPETVGIEDVDSAGIEVIEDAADAEDVASDSVTAEDVSDAEDVGSDVEDESAEDAVSVKDVVLDDTVDGIADIVPGAKSHGDEFDVNDPEDADESPSEDIILAVVENPEDDDAVDEVLVEWLDTEDDDIDAPVVDEDASDADDEDASDADDEDASDADDEDASDADDEDAASSMHLCETPVVGVHDGQEDPVEESLEEVSISDVIVDGEASVGDSSGPSSLDELMGDTDSEPAFSWSSKIGFDPDWDGS
ncbi:MAG: hypothetical protein E6R04_06645 [Spirochaetes bacterium]|nr:MAG: hypothetical protein E6R04_06645 [Spirochaetota bacterium]